MRKWCDTIGVECAKLYSVAEVHPWRLWLWCDRWQKYGLELGNGVQILLSFEVSGTFEGGHEVLECFDGLCDVFVLEVHCV